MIGKSMSKLTYIKIRILYNYKYYIPQNALMRDCNGKCIEYTEGQYLEVVVEVQIGWQ